MISKRKTETNVIVTDIEPVLDDSDKKLYNQNQPRSLIQNKKKKSKKNQKKDDTNLIAHSSNTQNMLIHKQQMQTAIAKTATNSTTEQTNYHNVTVNTNNKRQKLRTHKHMNTIQSTASKYQNFVRSHITLPASNFIIILVS